MWKRDMVFDGEVALLFQCVPDWTIQETTRSVSMEGETTSCTVSTHLQNPFREVFVQVRIDLNDGILPQIDKGICLMQS